MGKEFVIFDDNLERYIKDNINKSCRGILNVLDMVEMNQEQKKKLRKVILDEVNELGIVFKGVIDNLGKYIEDGNSDK